MYSCHVDFLRYFSNNQTRHAFEFANEKKTYINESCKYIYTLSTFVFVLYVYPLTSVVIPIVVKTFANLRNRLGEFVVQLEANRRNAALHIDGKQRLT